MTGFRSRGQQSHHPEVGDERQPTAGVPIGPLLHRGANAALEVVVRLAAPRAHGRIVAPGKPRKLLRVSRSDLVSGEAGPCSDVALAKARILHRAHIELGSDCPGRSDRAAQIAANECIQGFASQFSGHGRGLLTSRHRQRRIRPPLPTPSGIPLALGVPDQQKFGGRHGGALKRFRNARR